MKRDDVPKGKHLAIPTMNTDILHEGSYATSCEKCALAAVVMLHERMPRHEGKIINIGDAVRIKPEHLFTGMPEWTTITAIRLNTYTGEVWMHAFSVGENLVITADIIAEVRPWQEAA